MLYTTADSTTGQYMTMASIGTFTPIMDTPQYTHRHGIHHGIGISVQVGDSHSDGDIHHGIGDGIHHAGTLTTTTITTTGEATTHHTDITQVVGTTLSTETTAMQYTQTVAETDVEATYPVPPALHVHRPVSEQAQLHATIEIRHNRTAPYVRQQVPTECTTAPAAPAQELHATA